MKTIIYAIFDDKAKVYNKPFHQLNEEVMIRTCVDLLRDKASTISSHPEDYVVFELGTYDDTTAEYELIPGKRIIFRFSELPSGKELEIEIPTLGDKTLGGLKA